MKYCPIPSDFFVRNRQRFADRLTANTICLMASNDVQYTNADDISGFVQNNDLFYLSGMVQEDTILLLYPDAFKKENGTVLFIKKGKKENIVYDGEPFTKERASEISGIKRVEWLEDFETILQQMAFEADGFCLGHNEDVKRATKNIETNQDRLIKWCKQKYPLHRYYRAATITRDLRQIKSKEEISQIKKATEISVNSFKNVLAKCKPGVKEYELEAELTYNLIKSGADRHAFRPIVASGKNACVLHYNKNNNVCHDGEMVLMDFGACYAQYNSDNTRCFPVNGKFSSRQKEIYSAVLYCLKEGSKLFRPGVVLPEYEKLKWENWWRGSL